MGVIHCYVREANMGLWVKFDSHYTVISQNLQRLKKVFIDTTHSTVLIKVGLPSNHTLRSLQRIEGVVGKCG